MPTKAISGFLGDTLLAPFGDLFWLSEKLPKGTGKGTPYFFAFKLVFRFVRCFFRDGHFYDFSARSKYEKICQGSLPK